MILLPVAFLTVVCLLAIFLEYRPKTVELIDEILTVPQNVSDEITVIIWNIGYAGMSAEMDFVMDGGQQTRITKEQTQRNIQHIFAALDTMPADFFLLQEVDEKSKRSYRINQFAEIADALPEYHLNRAYNFQTGFVPVPVTNPIGRALSGLATLSKAPPVRAERYAFPNATPLPNRLFDLKRCFMVSEYKIQNNKKLYVINTHNSAFDSGEGRKKEMEHLRKVLENLYRQGNYVIVGGDWNQVPPDYPAVPTTPRYTPHRMSQYLLPDGWQVVYDKSVETVRFANESYVKGRTITATVDFFLVTPNVETLEIKGYALDFQNSDHNPVQAKFRLRRQEN